MVFIHQDYSGTCSVDGTEIHQMDIKTAFLNIVVEEEIYMEQ